MTTSMRTVGVDLAAEPPSTAVAAVEWGQGQARVVAVERPADDTVLLRHAEGADKVGIDCPLGWPDAFVAFVRAHQEGAADVVPQQAGARWRRSLAYRRTDERVRAALGRIPLSVATDRIGLTAMRGARLQALLGSHGYQIDRAGTGLIVEVYPAAGLKWWGLPDRGYKGTRNSAALGALLDSLRDRAPWLDFAEHEGICRASDHALDAVLAALLARAAAIGAATTPEDADFPAAAREGWIAVPTGALADLVTGQRLPPMGSG